MLIDLPFSREFSGWMPADPDSNRDLDPDSNRDLDSRDPIRIQFSIWLWIQIWISIPIKIQIQKMPMYELISIDVLELSKTVSSWMSQICFRSRTPSRGRKQ